jgi:tetratricopeptide (TPR) repeat protein
MKVFLSSTAEDLVEYRKVAVETIRRLGFESVAMEDFGPRPNAPIDECERLASQANLLVCIVAHRYGSVPEKSRGSFTQREVEAARAAGKDVLAWIVADDYQWSGLTEQDLLTDPNVLASSERVANVTEAIAALVNFKAWLQRTFVCESFTTSQDLRARMAEALAKYAPRQSTFSIPQNRISIARLPVTNSELFGRENELKILDDAWANSQINVVSFVAWGGVGKTALVNNWLKQRMARDNFRGAERLYGWSFFSQGSSERAASADLFIENALRWFGDLDPTIGSPWDKGERLAHYIRQSRTLLILDGIEPLQHPPGPYEGRLKDAAMQALLVELAAQQLGLCVISTRERIGDLIEFENGTVIQHSLDHLSPQAGTQILRSFDVNGEVGELEAASKEMHGHAFSLTLLGSYLQEVLDGDIRRRHEIDNLFEDSRYGTGADTMITAYEKWLGKGMELAILRLLSFFDRPADIASLSVLRERPAISGLTESLQDFKAREWSQAVGKLRRIKLLAEASPDQPGMLDSHPLVREHFKQQLKRDHSNAWREGNNRLFEYLLHATKQFPDTIEEMSPLYAAVAHGCAADRHEEALLVYSQRIQRGIQHFNWNNLGAYGPDLAVLSAFFEQLWEQPLPKLSHNAQSFVLNEAGVDLRALGRSQEALQSIKAGLEMDIVRKDWQNAAASATNLSGLLVFIGNLTEGLNLARQSVEFADRSQEYIPKIASRGALGDVLHKLGHMDEAAIAFDEFEAMLRNRTSRYSLLFGFAGFFYCDLLLHQGRVQEVKDRVEPILGSKLSLIDVALSNLSLGRAYLLEAQQAGTAASVKVGEFLQIALDGLRQATAMDLMPAGFLTRAEYYRLTSKFDLADRDLRDVWRIATRCEMALHQADYHLVSARLRFTQRNLDKAREHLTTAKEMINRMGYHRRDNEVVELEAQLA